MQVLNLLLLFLDHFVEERASVEDGVQCIEYKFILGDVVPHGDNASDIELKQFKHGAPSLCKEIGS